MARCPSSEVEENISSSWFISPWYDVIPLNPRLQPVNVLVVRPVYVIISLSIFNSPYSDGNPFVLLTLMVVSVDAIPTSRIVLSTTTSGVKLSSFKYCSRFSAISTGPPWYSWAI